MTVCFFLLLLGDDIMLACKLPILLLLKMWRFSCFIDFWSLWLRLLNL